MPKGIRPGQLRDVLQHETYTTSVSYGETTEAWSKGDAVRGHFEPETGDEQIRSGRVGNTQAARFTCRESAAEGITSDERFSYDGDVWEIVGPKRRIYGPPHYSEFLLELNPNETPATS